MRVETLNIKNSRLCGSQQYMYTILRVCYMDVLGIVKNIDMIYEKPRGTLTRRAVEVGANVI